MSGSAARLLPRDTPGRGLRRSSVLPTAQQEIRARCRHPGGTFTPFPLAATGQSVARRFEQIARLYADRPAVVTSGYRLTYAQFNETANRISHAVLNERDTAEEPVAILMEKDAPAIASVFGLLKAGKIAVPLDPYYPKARLADLIEESGARLILASDRHADQARLLAGDSRQVLNVEDLNCALSAGNPDLSLAADTLGYILFTSGSTGRPKGVVHDHRSLLHQAMRMTNALRMCPDDRSILLASMSTAQAGVEIFLPLLNGAALFPRDLKQDGLAGLGAWLNRQQITYYRSSATVFREWVKCLDAEERFPALRLLKIGGEPVVQQDVLRFREHFPTQCVFFNALSSSECWTTCLNAIGHDTPLETNLVPVGYPVEDLRVSLVDESGAAPADGETGEMIVQTRGMARGYWRHGQLDPADFVPTSDEDGARVFRTNDLACSLPDGGFLHLGRKDTVIKIRGHRIDVSEVEAVLRDKDDVQQAAVIAQEDAHGDKRLVAYVVPRGEQPPTRGAIRQFVKERLPEHMIPYAFVLLLEMPMTPSGKIERRSLPPYTPPVFKDSDGTEASRTLIGAQLCTIWEEVLGLPQVGLRDDFLELGGDSLLALTMAMRMEQVCGRTIALSRLLEGVTIERLVDILMEDERENFGKPVIAVQPGGSKRALYWLHGDFDHGGLYCHSLARHLGADQPFYALTPHGLDGRELPWSIEAMARERLTALRSVQPHGPYRLGGFCIGGVVAFEMARQLRDQGEHVDIVLLVDARAVNTPWPCRTAAGALRGMAWLLRWSEAKRRKVFLTFRMHLWAFQTSAMPGGEGRLKFILDKCVAVMHRLRPSPVPGSASPRAAPINTSGVDVLWQRFCAYKERLDDYLPRHLDGPVVMFRSSHLDDKPPGGATAGWNRAADTVDVHYLPGNHQACVTRHVAVLAEKMRPYLP